MRTQHNSIFWFFKMCDVKFNSIQVIISMCDSSCERWTGDEKEAGCIRDEGLPRTTGNLLEGPDNQRLGKERSDKTLRRGSIHHWGRQREEIQMLRTCSTRRNPCEADHGRRSKGRRRGRGRPMTSWIGNSKEWSRMSAGELTKMAGSDRTEWRNLIRKWGHQRPYQK